MAGQPIWPFGALDYNPARLRTIHISCTGNRRILMDVFGPADGVSRNGRIEQSLDGGRAVCKDLLDPWGFPKPQGSVKGLS